MMNFKKNVFKKGVMVKVHYLSLEEEQFVDRSAQCMLKHLKTMVSPKLFDAITKHFYGFSGSIQLEMAYDLIRFAKRHELYFTNCPSVDAVLSTFYLLIAKEQDILKSNITEIEGVQI